MQVNAIIYKKVVFNNYLSCNYASFYAPLRYHTFLINFKATQGYFTFQCYLC